MKSSSLFPPHSASSLLRSGTARGSSGNSVIFHTSAVQNMRCNQNVLQLKCANLWTMCIICPLTMLYSEGKQHLERLNWTFFFFFCINMFNFAVFDILHRMTGGCDLPLWLAGLRCWYCVGLVDADCHSH